MSITGQTRNKFRFRFYRNLNKGGWSVSESGKHIKNEDVLHVFNAQFYSRPAGRAKVIESGVKNVHAYMVSNSAYENNHPHAYLGSEYGSTNARFIEISYNPFVSENFFFKFKYSDRIYIDSRWVIPEVVSSASKLYINKKYLYQFLKDKTWLYGNLANKVFFDGIQITDLIAARDLLHTLLQHRNEIMCGGEMLPGYNFDTSCGLCDNLVNNTPSYMHEVFGTWLEAMFEEWEHYSGFRLFPIVDPDYSPSMPNLAYENTDNKYTGNYGANRFRLAEYLLKRMTENVPDLQTK